VGDLSCGGFDENIYITLFCNKTHLHLSYYNNENVYFLLFGQNRSINGLRFPPKRKNEKTKKHPKILNPFPLIHLEVVNINFNLEGLVPL
jgi:hypothetical protein